MKTASTPPSVLIVDDTPQNISLLNAALMGEYTIKVASGGLQAIDICLSMPIDIILLDVMMPGIDGFETCRRLKEDQHTCDIPVIFVTASGDINDESHGFAYGGVDFITKPIRPAIVQARVKTHLALHDQNHALSCLVQERTDELDRSRLEILQRLGSAGEYRDNETGLHVVRVCHYSRIIAQALGLPEHEADLLYNTAALHDTGKIGIPDSILLKPGRLNDEEWKIMRTHCAIGYEIIGANQNRLLKSAATIALTHHERWDGSGYPKGLKGSEIPLCGRIVAVVDMFDALTSERPYKKAWSVGDAVEEVGRCSGGHFDPQIVDAFMRKTPELIAVKQQFADVV